MGGARSEVNDSTTTVVSEVATWNGPNIHNTALKLSAAQRGLEPQREAAAARADAVGAGCRHQAVRRGLWRHRPARDDRSGWRRPRAGDDPPARCAHRGCCSASRSRVSAPGSCSQTIGFTATDAADGLNVTVPDFRRADVTREADLIEEVSRLDGLENLPATLPARHAAVGRLTPTQVLRRRASDALAAQGLHEIVGWSFTGPDQRLPKHRDGRRAADARQPDVIGAVAAARRAADLTAGRCRAQPRPRRRRKPDRAVRVRDGLPLQVRRASQRRAPAGRVPSPRRDPQRSGAAGHLASTPTRHGRTSSPPRVCWRACSRRWVSTGT